MTIAKTAIELVRPDSVVGLGTGHAASDFIRLLGDRVSNGLKVRGVASSIASESLAREVGVPLVNLAEVGRIEATFDGADAVDPELDLIKGLGGALLREKILAAASDRLIILVGSEKLTEKLGQGYCKVLPVEVVPFGLPLVQRKLSEAGLQSQLRIVNDQPLITDNGNYTLDLTLEGLESDPKALANELRSIPGIVETGLFLEMATTVMVQYDDGRVDVRHKGG